MSIQVEWYCDVCKAKHFGNCPKMIIEVTTTTTGGGMRIWRGDGTELDPFTMKPITLVAGYKKEYTEDIK